MKTLRIFICIDFPPEIVKEISCIQSLIVNKEFTGKLTEPENLHLTLKFLGEINQQKKEQVEYALEEHARLRFFPKTFEAKFEETGTFDYKGSPRIAWIRVGGLEILNLQKQIDRALKKLFKSEERFMSHLTIARIKYVKNKQAFKDFVKSLPIKPLNFRVDCFKLKSSELTRLGSRYTVLKTYNLVDYP